MSFRKYRAIDLIVLTVLLAACEILSVYIENSPINDIHFSLSIFILILAMFRWNQYSLFVCVGGFFLAGIGEVLLLNLPAVTILTNILCNIFAEGLLIAFRLVKKERFEQNPLLVAAAVVMTFSFIGVGSGFIGWLFEGKPFWDTFRIYLFVYHPLSVFVSVLLGVLLYRHQGLFRDQRQMILRQNSGGKI